MTGDTTTPTIKPSVASLRSQTVSSLWTTIAKFKSGAYGLNTTNLDSHMMKNMEWGAVAYLAQSKYGINSEIFINNSQDYTTGCAGNTVSAAPNATCQNAYNTTNGFKASTTGNITGIYDMSGGAWEYTMGNMANSSANYTNHVMYVSSAGNTFGTYSDSDLPHKYYDIYDYDASSSITHARGLLGDATKETVVTFGVSPGWNGDYAVFPNATYSWFQRGGGYNNTSFAGVFASNSSAGGAGSDYSARSVLVNNN